MSTRAVVTINTPADRDQVSRWAQKVSEGTIVEFRKKTRSHEQSAKMWAMLHEVAEQVEWYGTKMDAEDWKDVFTASLRHARVVPGIDKGTFVPLGMRTSSMTIEEMSNLIELVYAFGAEHGVVFKDPQENNTDSATADQSPSGQSPDNDEAAPTSSQDGGEASSPSASSPSSRMSSEENAVLIRYARDVLPRAARPESSSATMSAIEHRWASDLSKLSEQAKDGARAISQSMRSIMEDPERLSGIIDHYAEVLDCSVEELGGAA